MALMLLTFLCLRRGVSIQGSAGLSADNFSLPTQRCFRLARASGDPPSLFSAYAEVFLSPASSASRRCPFLCLRRGVSISLRDEIPEVPFSLPTQRCFSIYPPDRRHPLLFSAYAEVFLARLSISITRTGLFSAYAEVFPLHPSCHIIHHVFSLPTQRCFDT